jgi:hypothetical protein
MMDFEGGDYVFFVDAIRVSIKNALKLPVITVVLENINHFLSFPLSPSNSSNTAQYDDDNNSVRMYMRGRPVNFYVPEKRADALNYDITKVQPAPTKKLKLDWVGHLNIFHNSI